MKVLRVLVNVLISLPLAFATLVLTVQAGVGKTAPAAPPISDSTPDSPSGPSSAPPADDGGDGAVPRHPLAHWPAPYVLRSGTWLLHVAPGQTPGGVQEYLLCQPQAGYWVLIDADEGLPYSGSMARTGGPGGGLTRENFAELIGGVDRIPEWEAFTRRPW